MSFVLQFISVPANKESIRVNTAKFQHGTLIPLVTYMNYTILKKTFV